MASECNTSDNNNWYTEFSSYKLNIQYIIGAKNTLADCLSRLVYANFSDCDYKPKGQEFAWTLFNELPMISNADPTDSFTKDSEKHDIIKNLQKQKAYCKHIHSTLHILSESHKFTIKDDTLFKVIQHVGKSFEALIVPMSSVLSTFT